jgi:hypothetical protein
MPKQNSRRTELDPRDIFEHASRFHSSDLLLRRGITGPNDFPVVAHPSMVLSAFASELYLKCFLCVERGTFPDTHDLKALFEELQPATRRVLENLWDADMRTPRQQKSMEAIRALPEGKNVRLDLQYALDVGANSFIQLRYIYETKKAFFLLGDFPNLLRKVILDRFPTWG